MAVKQANKQNRSMTIGSPMHVEPKTIAAVILVAVMGALWARVLFRSGPTTAMAETAAAADAATQQTATETGLRIQAVALPRIPGRHDVIADDFFSAKRCSAWNQTAETAVPVKQVSDDQQIIHEIVKSVALEAIIKDANGNAEKACINGTILTAGSVLRIPVKNEMLSIRVVTIDPGRVRLSWQDRSIDIEMPDQKVN